MSKVLIKEELLLGIMDGNSLAKKLVRDSLFGKYVILKEDIEDAYENYNSLYDIESVKAIYSVFGISEYKFIKYLYDLYEKNSEMFLVSTGKNRKAVINKILRRYLYVSSFKDSLEVKRKIFNTVFHYNSDEIIKKYVNDEYYNEDAINIILKILNEADSCCDYKVVEEFIELKPFSEESAFIFKHFGELNERVIKLYFNKDGLFRDIFDIAAYLAKVEKPSMNICEFDKLSNIQIDNLQVNDSILNILKENFVRTIENLQIEFDRDNIMSLNGMDVESARIIIDALGKFYLKGEF